VCAARDLIELHDTSKAISSRREAVLGDHAEIFTFVNPSRVRPWHGEDSEPIQRRRRTD
jgi:hypothetical protein